LLTDYIESGYAVPDPTAGASGHIPALPIAP